MRTLRVHLSESNMQKAQQFKDKLQDSWLALFNSNITTSDILRALLMLGLELMDDAHVSIESVKKQPHTTMINAPLWIHDSIEIKAHLKEISKTKVAREAIHRACMHCDTPKDLLRALIDNL